MSNMQIVSDPNGNILSATITLPVDTTIECTYIPQDTIHRAIATSLATELRAFCTPLYPPIANWYKWESTNFEIYVIIYEGRLYINPNPILTINLPDNAGIDIADPNLIKLIKAKVRQTPNAA